MKTTRMANALTVMLRAWACLGIVEPAIAQVQADQSSLGSAADSQRVSAPTPGTAMPKPDDRPADQQALRLIAKNYTRAYNAGDAKTLASLFAEDAEMIDENGERLRGRRTIEQVFGSMFRERPGATISISPTSLRFLGPAAAEEEGRTIVNLTGEDQSSIHHYTVIFVKTGDHWMYSSVREGQEPGLTPHQHLQGVAWLTGDWIDESPDSVVHASCKWTDDKNFLLRDFTIRVQGKSVMTVNERIGWDPSTRQIKSWVFDSEGGHGSGLWSRNGNEWVIKSTGVLPDGRIATATHILTRLGPQSAKWSSVERTVGDQVVPDHAEYVMVRRPPPPKGQ